MVLDTKTNMTFKYSLFLLSYDITNETTVKLLKIDGMPAALRLYPQKHVPTILVGIPCLNLIYLGPSSQQKTEANRII